MSCFNAGLIAMASLALIACSPEPTASEPKTIRVKSIKVSAVTSEENIYFPAVATASDLSELSFRVPGEITKLNVNEGSRVKKGEVLAEIDANDFKIKVDNAVAKFNVLDSQYKRSKPLVEKELLAKSQFDEIAAKRAIAKAELDLVKLQLSFTKLKAPFDGLISRVIVDNFQSVQAGQQVFNIHRIENVDVLIQIPDRMVIKQSTDTDRPKIDSIVRTQSGNEYPASLKEFTTEPNPNTGTYTVTLTMPMPKEEVIFDGMALEVTGKRSAAALTVQSAIEIPIEAISNSDGDSLDRTQKFVWIVQSDGTVTKTLITTGKLHSSSVEIIDGISPGDEVVVAGISRLREGIKVEVVAQEAGL